MAKRNYSGFEEWIKKLDSESSTIISIDKLAKDCNLDEGFPKNFNWSNNSQNAKKYWLPKHYVVYKTSNLLIFEYNRLLDGIKFNSSASTFVYACFKADAKDAFYKQLNFCPHYFKNAVKHFYDTPANSQKTTCNGKKIEAETRYNSWVQCYNHFQKLKKSTSPLNKNEIDEACVRLGFYMASWGMYRGSSFLLQNDYNIYKGIIPILFNKKYNDLWHLDKNINCLLENNDPITDVDSKINHWAQLIMELATKIRIQLCPYRKYYIEKSYFTDHSTQTSYTSVSKTLVTKLLLGTVGCYPALDRYFSEAIGSVANDLSEEQIKCILALAYYVKKGIKNHSITIKVTDNQTLSISNYPIMKLIDMYYFTFGMEKPFLKLISELITGKKTISNPSGNSKELTNDDIKLLKQFILYNGIKMPPYDVDIAFPCSPLKKQNTPCCCGLDICNLAAVNPSNNEGIDYTNILDKLTDPKGELYEKISKTSAEEAKKEDEE